MFSISNTLSVVFIIYLVTQQYCVCVNNQSTTQSSNKIQADNVWERRILETSKENITDLPDILTNETEFKPMANATEGPGVDTRFGVFDQPPHCPPGQVLVGSRCRMGI